MNIFDGRPDLLVLFVAQIAFILIQILIYLSVSRAEKHSSHRIEKTHVKKTAKRKLGKRAR